MRDDFTRYTEKNVILLAINSGSARSHRSFAHRLTLPIPLLIDRRLKVARRYDAVLNLGFVQIVKRTVVGVDPNGQIIFYRRGTPSTDDILSGLSSM